MHVSRMGYVSREPGRCGDPVREQMTGVAAGRACAVTVRAFDRDCAVAFDAILGGVAPAGPAISMLTKGARVRMMIQRDGPFMPSSPHGLRRPADRPAPSAT